MNMNRAMKRAIHIFFACCILFSFGNIARGQNPATGQYRLTIKSNTLVNIGNGMNGFDIKLWTNIESEANPLLEENIEKKVKTNSSIPMLQGNMTWLYNASQRPNTVHTFMRRRWRTALGIGYNTSLHRNQKSISTTTPYVDIIASTGNNGNRLFASCEAELHIMLYPEKIDIGYYNSNGVADGTNYFPDNDPITLKATAGFVPDTYLWQYSTDMGSTWSDFPSSLQKKHEITFTGADIIPFATLISLVGNSNILVRVNTPTAQSPTSTIVTLSPRISAPHILSADVSELEKCYDSGDAKVRITFARPLVNGETISVGIDNVFSSATSNYTSFDGTNSIIIENVEAGNRTFTITGAYNGYAMYTGSASHSKTVTVANRPKITHDVISAKEVSCYDGSDGSIIIGAGGGDGIFIGRLYFAGMNDVIQEVAFLESESATFTRLAAGNYEVRVFDTNGCTAYRDNGTVLVHQVTINQPAQPVEVTLEHTLNPLAHDSHDGKATVRVSGGTPAQSGYIVISTHEDGQSYAPASRSADGNDILYTFDGLQHGSYSVTIQDKNFASLDPQDRTDPCGCSAVLNFSLSAPQAIDVEIEETHFVNWHGGNQGELTAHATGGIKLSSAMPYQYIWYKQSDAGIMQPVAMPNDSIARNLTAGIYQIKVTDANGVSKTSAVYTLSQPDPILVQFVITQTGCQGGSSGKVAATVSGGVEPYNYQWNVEGATGNEITSLEAGAYMLKITDARGGQLLANAEVTSTSTLQIDSLIAQPSCIAPGSIKLQLSGATPPYTITWDDTHSDDLIRNDLTPGIYRLSVVDANGCANFFTFDLKEPRRFTVDLGSDLIMCLNQTRVLEAICDEPAVVYEWYFNGTKLPDTGARITIDKEGTYSVKATNPQGCSASDQVDVMITNETLELDMTIPTTIESGSEIHAVNLSKAPADRIEWKVPPGAVIIKQTELELVFTLNTEGSYTIAMEGFKGEGATIVTRTINIVGRGEVTLPDSEKPLIKQFWVTPNPSTGYFKVVVELNQEEDFTMLLFSPQGTEMDRKEVKATQSRTFEYEINGILQGTYLLHLITKADRSALQIVIKK